MPESTITAGQPASGDAAEVWRYVFNQLASASAYSTRFYHSQRLPTEVADIIGRGEDDRAEGASVALLMRAAVAAGTMRSVDADDYHEHVIARLVALAEFLPTCWHIIDEWAINDFLTTLREALDVLTFGGKAGESRTARILIREARDDAHDRAEDDDAITGVAA